MVYLLSKFVAILSSKIFDLNNILKLQAYLDFIFALFGKMAVKLYTISGIISYGVCYTVGPRVTWGIRSYGAG